MRSGETRPATECSFTCPSGPVKSTAHHGDSMQRIKARFAGTCAACNGKFARNAPILFDAEAGAAYEGDCADAIELSQ